MFSTEQVKLMLWPGITMIKSIDIPGTFIERWEGIIMAIWTLFFLLHLPIYIIFQQTY
ncbi:GerAB/ArcD/ProY family transporter [Clostridium botulinum]|nr:GerAB/ArcD/ProY family transporter [Clostridium botulinum]MCS4524456.1 GerAB/ArcD/ProY family transporter [Clostridium botulinum]MCS4527493.1 GerAB/ArcD/ProY family transporter [Clostridium botulinum]